MTSRIKDSASNSYFDEVLDVRLSKIRTDGRWLFDWLALEGPVRIQHYEKPIGVLMSLSHLDRLLDCLDSPPQITLPDPDPIQLRELDPIPVQALRIVYCHKEAGAAICLPVEFFQSICKQTNETQQNGRCKNPINTDRVAQLIRGLPLKYSR